MKSNDDNERELLIGRLTNSYNGGEHHKHPSSRLEWAEKSWIRWPYIVFWWWVSPILALGYKQNLTVDDFDDLPHADKCSVLFDQINNYNRIQMTLLKILIRAFWKSFMFNSILLVLYRVASTAQPLILLQIVLHISDHQVSSPSSINSAYFYAVALFVCTLFQSLMNHQYYFYSTRLDLRIRNSLTSIIYAHLLTINTASLQQMTTAHMLNLIANDATKFDEFSSIIHFLWVAPLEALIDFVLLCWIIGLYPILCGYTIFILLIPLQILWKRQFSQYRQTTMRYADKRIRAYKELIAGCQVIKIYNWEKAIEDHVCRMRELELASIRRASLLRALNMSVMFVSSLLLGFATYAGAWFSSRPLKTVDLFVAITFYGQMRTSVIYSLPRAIEKLGEIQIVWKRIDAFMKLKMRQQQPQKLPTSDKDNWRKKGAIVMHNASFSWHDEHSCLSALNIIVEPGTFVGIAGPVGSGKSSLFAAILGEMIQTNGQLDVNGSSFAYVAQSSWIFSDTFRANILLGKPFDKQRYEKVLRACCLDVDLNAFGSTGDLIIIGENGINLSGGQKARVSLARALYSDADIYLLDDPLAAVDHIVAKRIYNQCIGPHGLLSTKTRLLITHQIEFLVESHKTIILTHGHISTQGHFDELINEYRNIDQNNDAVEKEEIPVSSAMLDIGQATVDTQSIIADESLKSHTVNWSVWKALLIAPSLGLLNLFILINLLVITEILYDGTHLWLSLWSKRSNTDKQHRLITLYIYFGLTIATLMFAIIRTIYFFYYILNGSNRLHKKMLSGLLYTSMRFFESNPSGRILNRAIKDQQVVDELLPNTLFSTIQRLLSLVGSVIIICIADPWVTLLLIPTVPTFWMLRRYYLRSSCQIKRLESVTRSPAYALLASSLTGLSTIRAFKVTDDVMHLFMKRIDDNTRVTIIMAGSVRWFSSRFDLLLTFVSFVSAIVAVVLHDKISPSLIALSLMYSINMINMVQFALQQSADTENFMTSAERIDEYAQLAPEEDQGGSKRLITMPSDWPIRGTIEFRNYSLRYRCNLELALKNINLTIRSGEKIGIIGRTGAGKSSLFQGILRLIDRSTVDGLILIDDIDISRVTLNHLRSHLSVIPQQPVLFSGTLRYNLDPFDAYSDDQCWMALEDVQLKNMVFKHPDGLLMIVNESGSNFSVGQCQLICVARAILKPSKILLIDEATANVDKETDRLLQSIIANKFQDRTVLTIAHRLNTVANNDRLLVLDRGMVVDFDVPEKILPHYQ